MGLRQAQLIVAFHWLCREPLSESDKQDNSPPTKAYSFHPPGVISGGSACNHIARSFHAIADHDVCYVLGISDNGGSTSELLRVLGGPSIGDLRSRLTRLVDIVDNSPSPERVAIKELLSYRLSADASEQEVKDEWASIVEGRHQLWVAIPVEKKEAIRGFLTSFNSEILRRAHKRFNFNNGSIGNFFLTGARLFFGSLEASLFLFSAITGITEPTTVVPVINTNHTATIAAKLRNGATLVGQCEISHPAPTSRKPSTPTLRRINPIDAFSHLSDDEATDDDETLCNENLVFSKAVEEKLVSAIERIYYINEYGQEIYPVPNPKVVDHLGSKETLVYCIGSLYTSIVPCLVLRHVGNAIARSTSLKHKILLLNGSNDRETSDHTALDFITTITAALNESQSIDARRAFYQSCDNQSLHPIPSLCMSSLSSVESTNSSAFSFASTAPSSYSSTPYLADNLSGSPASHYPPFPGHLFLPSPPSAFITHLIYLDNSAISVDTDAIEKLGIRCIAITGAVSPDGKPVYDESILTTSLDALIHT